MRKLKKVLLFIFYIYFFILFFNLLLIIYTKFYFSTPDTISDKKVGFLRRPNTVSYCIRKEFNVKFSINSLSLRDDELQTNDKNKIIVIGDSFVEGWGVEQAKIFSKLLENKYLKKSYKVINMGVLGFEPLQEYLFVKEIGLKFKPKIVIDFVYLENDILDIGKDWCYGMLKYKKPYLIETNSTFQIAYPKDKPSFLSSLLNFILPKKIITFAYFIDASSISKKFLTENDLDELYPIAFLTKTDNEYLLSYKKLNFVLSEFKKLSVANNFKLIIVYIPSKFQLNEIYLKAFLKKNKKENFAYDLDTPDRLLKEICQRSGIIFLDLKPEFKKVKSPLSLYFKIDPHFNESGHELVAKIIYNFLSKKEMIKK